MNRIHIGSYTTKNYTTVTLPIMSISITRIPLKLCLLKYQKTISTHNRQNIIIDIFFDFNSLERIDCLQSNTKHRFKLTLNINLSTHCMYLLLNFCRLSYFGGYESISLLFHDVLPLSVPFLYDV